MKRRGMGWTRRGAADPAYNRIHRLTPFLDEGVFSNGEPWAEASLPPEVDEDD